MPDNEIIWIASTSALNELAATLAQQRLIAVDTEADSLYSYFEKVCLVQISTRENDYVIDPLAVTLAPLAPIFSDARVEKTFHAAEYDILCLKRDYGFEFANLFDTMIAARILGWEKVGLGNILEARYGVALNKKFQRADWGRRPLSRAELDYAREDTHYLLALRELQIGELQKHNRLDEAREAFARLARSAPTPRQFDPDEYAHISGARQLDPARRGILRELYRLRDAQARRENRPPFKILSDATMLAIATARPVSARALQNLSGITSHIFQRYSSAILDAIRTGLARPQAQLPRATHSDALDPRARARLGKLKEWRKARAEARGVATDVIISNDMLFALARQNPQTLDALLQSEMGAWKIQTYGEEILAVLNGKK